MASPKDTELKDAKDVYVFESAYDAMAFYQLRMQKDSGLDYNRPWKQERSYGEKHNV